jgi:polyhydroxyalkanoate synthesis regulator phasin
MSDSIYLGAGDTIQRPQQGAGGGASRAGTSEDADLAEAKAIIHQQWQQYAAAFVVDGEMTPEQAKAYGKKLAEADIIRKLHNYGVEPEKSTTGAPWRRAQGIAVDDADTPARWLEPL